MLSNSSNRLLLSMIDFFSTLAVDTVEVIEFSLKLLLS